MFYQSKFYDFCALSAKILWLLRNLYIPICKAALEEAIFWYCISVNADEYALDIGYIISNRTRYYGDESEIDTDEAERIVYNEIVNMLIEEIFSLLSELPLEIHPEIEFINDLTIDIIGCKDLINNYIKADEEDKRDGASI